jgi:excinuclease ABC subunit C
VNQQLDEKLEKLPRSPGVYFHKSKSGEVIYVGKAAVLKNRVRQYFQDSRLRDNKTMALVAEIYDTDWIETESEVDALFLESEMVKRYMPRYNVLLRDDKSQTYVRIDMKSDWPVVSFTRNPVDDGADYYGPFYSGYALRKALRYLRKVYPYLTKERRPGQSRLEEDLGLSPRLSDGAEHYKANLRKLISYIKGNRKTLTNELEKEMKFAAGRQDFEVAAMLRNKLQAMRELQRRVMFGDREFLDIPKDRALADISDLLMLKKIPARIEGYDISHMSGSNVVASMVVFSNGVSDRSEYRKFKVDEKNDDVDNMRQVVFRRLSPRNLKSWGEPDIILIDGGKSQLMAAIDARDKRGVEYIPIISIAKREEELLVCKSKSSVGVNRIKQLSAKPMDGVYVVDEGDFYVVNLHVNQKNASAHSRNLRASSGVTGRYDDVVKLLQRIRDEAHRFAVSYHTALKRNRQTKSLLDDIPGVGPATRRKLLKRFGSASAVMQASELDLAEVIGASKARSVKVYIGKESEHEK